MRLLLLSIGLWALSARVSAGSRGLLSSKPSTDASFSPESRLDWTDAIFTCPDALFVLGTSLSDTGNFARILPISPSALPPYGITYPGSPSGRFSDGLLVVDFLAQALGLPLPQPFLNTVSANFTSGINFAVFAATARSAQSQVPSSLQLQVTEAIQFASTALSANSPYPVPPAASFTKQGLYYIEIGSNDIAFALRDGTRLETIRAVIGPEIVSNISLAITRLYNGIGARQFLIWNIPPIGCSTFALTLYQQVPGAGPIDQAGCLAGLNAVVQQVNTLIEAALLIEGILSTLSGAKLFLADVNQLLHSVARNPSQHGFTEPFAACCGSSTGVYNYNTLIPCGPTVLTSVCMKPHEYVNWDGIHPTHGLNEVVANAILSGNSLLPPISLLKLCQHRS